MHPWSLRTLLLLLICIAGRSLTGDNVGKQLDEKSPVDFGVVHWTSTLCNTKLREDAPVIPRARNPLCRFASLLLAFDQAAACSSYCERVRFPVRHPVRHPDLASSNPAVLQMSRSAPAMMPAPTLLNSEENLDLLRVVDLKDKLRSLGLKVSGTKPALVARLEQHAVEQRALAPKYAEVEGQLDFWPGPRKLQGNQGALGKFTVHGQSREEIAFWQAQRDKMNANLRIENGPAPSLFDLGLIGHHNTSPRVLICGDAHFAYARLIARHLKTATIFATTYEHEDELRLAYPHVEDAKQELLQKGITVQHGVDARKILNHFGEDARFDRIVFNLPHSGKRMIDDNRFLLEELCISAAEALAPGGEFWVVLLAGQGGTPVDPVPRDPRDTWQIIDCAANAGLLVRDVAEVDIAALEAEGYVPTGRQGHLPLGAERKQKGLVVHVLAAESPPPLAEGVSRESDKKRDEARTAKSIVTFKYVFQNSFWLHGESAVQPPEPRQILEVAQEALGPLGAEILSEPPLLKDVFQRNGSTSHLYSFEYRSRVISLSRDRALQANEIVAQALVERFSFERRKGEPGSR